MSEDVAQRAKAALQGVSEGPWESRLDPLSGGFFIERAVGDDPLVGFDFDGEDARFIAAARDLVPELVAEVERKSAQIAEWRAQYEAIDRDHERLSEEPPTHAELSEKLCADKKVAKRIAERRGGNK